MIKLGCAISSGDEIHLECIARGFGYQLKVEGVDGEFIDNSVPFVEFINESIKLEIIKACKKGRYAMIQDDSSYTPPQLSDVS